MPARVPEQLTLLVPELGSALKSRLARRQVRWVLVVALSVGFLLSAGQIITDYRSHDQSLQRSIELLLDATRSAAASAAWHLDDDLARVVCTGMVAHPAVSDCRIGLSADVSLTSVAGEVPAGSWLFSQPLFGGSQMLDMPLYHRDQEHVGQLELVLNPVQATNEFLGRAMVVVTAGILRALVLAAALFVVFHLLVTQRVLHLSGSLRAFVPGQSRPDNPRPQPPAAGKRTDELTCLERSADDLMATLDVQFEELVGAKADLENKVADRTRELEDAMKALRHQAQTDPLTGLANRHALFEAARRYMDNWTRYGERFAVLLLDLDHFKSINDDYGHAVGDEALKQVGLLLQESSRGGDVAARFGGEEFVLLIKVLDGAEALGTAERLREAMTSLRFTEHDLRLTASIGVATIGPDIPNLDALISRADDAMYDAKHSGRNQVRAFQPAIDA